MSTKITLELTPDEAFWMQQFCVDAAIVWYENWQNAADGKRPDLDVDSCQRLNRRAHEFADRIRGLSQSDHCHRRLLKFSESLVILPLFSIRTPMTNHTRYLTFDADNNLIDYLIELIFETLQRWPEDYYLSDFNENWVDSHISNIWDEYWTCLTQEQQSEIMDYIVSCVSESFEV